MSLARCQLSSSLASSVPAFTNGPVGADRPDLSGQVEPDLLCNLGLNGSDSEDLDFHVGLGCQDRQRDFAVAESVDRADADRECDARQYRNLDPGFHAA